MNCYSFFLHLFLQVEGWHTRMNKQKARGSHNLPFYVLLELLRKEADLLPLQRLLVDEGKLQCLQRKSSKLVRNDNAIAVLILMILGLCFDFLKHKEKVKILLNITHFTFFF